MQLNRRNFITGSIGFAAGGIVGGAAASELLPKLNRSSEGIAEVLSLAGQPSTCDLPEKELSLDRLQRTTIYYYLHETNPDNGLVRDKTDPTGKLVQHRRHWAGFLHRSRSSSNAACSIGRLQPSLPCVGFCFLYSLPQGTEPDAAGYKGFFYHFLDMDTGRRVWKCELSTIDSAILFAGMLTASTYFDKDTADEAEVRRLSDAIYRRVDWNWARNGKATITNGWYPETGFILYRYEGYDEGLLLYLLGLGSPTFPLPVESYAAFCSHLSVGRKSTTARCSTPGRSLRINYRTCGSIFAASATLSCASTNPITLKNSRQATDVQQMYAVKNPNQFAGYDEHSWGFSAGDGPGWVTRTIKGVKREFFGYAARGAPFGPDDGTVAPWAVVASLPFAPEIVIPTLCHFSGMKLGGQDRQYGFKPSFNESFPDEKSLTGWWVTPHYFGIDQGPVALMIENYRTGLIWNVMRRCPYLVTGFSCAGRHRRMLVVSSYQNSFAGL